MNNAAARVENGTKIFGEGDTAVAALTEVSLSFGQGRFTAIMGPSGSGKSTLLHCTAGLDRLTSGSVHIGDVELGTLNDRELTRLRRDKIGFIFQTFNLVPTLSAEENISLPMSIAGREGEQDWLDYVIEILGLEDRLGHRPSELSGGQQQRVAAARALASRPEIIFADEPSGNLDRKSGTELLDFLRRAVDEFSQTIVMVTHDPIGASVSERVIFLADGQCVDELHDPTPDSILDQIKQLEA